jgi:hypothetical protein
LNGEPKLSQYADGTRLPTLEIAGSKTLAGRELVSGAELSKAASSMSCRCRASPSSITASLTAASTVVTASSAMLGESAVRSR